MISLSNSDLNTKHVVLFYYKIIIFVTDITPIIKLACKFFNVVKNQLHFIIFSIRRKPRNKCITYFQPYRKSIMCFFVELVE